MRDLLPQLEAKGAHLVVVGNGAPGFIPAFREATKFPGPIYSDKKREAYAAAALTRGVGRTLLHPRALLAGVRAFAKGFRQGATQGDPWQQGGVLVIDSSGEVLYHYASAFSGDHPPDAAILDAVGRATKASAK